MGPLRVRSRLHPQARTLPVPAVPSSSRGYRFKAPTSARVGCRRPLHVFLSDAVLGTVLVCGHGSRLEGPCVAMVCLKAEQRGIERAGSPAGLTGVTQSPQ